MASTAAAVKAQNGESAYYASQRELVWRRFKRHKLAIAGGIVVILLYLIALFAPFIGPYDPQEFNKDFNFVPPSKNRFISEAGKWVDRAARYNNCATFV